MGSCLAWGLGCGFLGKKSSFDRLILWSSAAHSSRTSCSLLPRRVRPSGVILAFKASPGKSCIYYTMKSTKRRGTGALCCPPPRHAQSAGSRPRAAVIPALAALIPALSLAEPRGSEPSAPSLLSKKPWQSDGAEICRSRARVCVSRRGPSTQMWVPCGPHLHQAAKEDPDTTRQMLVARSGLCPWLHNVLTPTFCCFLCFKTSLGDFPAPLQASRICAEPCVGLGRSHR